MTVCIIQCNKKLLIKIITKTTHPELSTDEEHHLQYKILPGLLANDPICLPSHKFHYQRKINNNL